jgi:hypothetical protein
VSHGGLTARLLAKIRRDFHDDRQRVVGQLHAVVSGNQDRERVLAAVVAMANGDLDRLQKAVELSTRDWRDVLLASGLANADWPERLVELLGTYK